MANQKKRAEEVRKTPPFRGYVRKDLSSSEDVDAFHVYEHNCSKETLFDSVLKSVDDGYKVSLKIDGKGFKVEMFNVSSDEGSQGYILSAYGSSVQKALTALFFKHYELLEEDWSSYVGDGEVEVR